MRTTKASKAYGPTTPATAQSPTSAQTACAAHRRCRRDGRGLRLRQHGCRPRRQALRHRLALGCGAGLPLEHALSAMTSIATAMDRLTSSTRRRFHRCRTVDPRCRPCSARSRTSAATRRGLTAPTPLRTPAASRAKTLCWTSGTDARISSRRWASASRSSTSSSSCAAETAQTAACLRPRQTLSTRWLRASPASTRAPTQS